MGMLATAAALAAAASPAGFAPAVTVQRSTCSSQLGTPVVMAAPGGRAVVAYSDDCRGHALRTAALRGGRVVARHRVVRRTVFDAWAASDARGRGVLAWTIAPHGHAVLQARRLDADGRLRGAPLLGAGAGAAFPELSVAGGRGLLAFGGDALRARVAAFDLGGSGPARVRGVEGADKNGFATVVPGPGGEVLAAHVLPRGPGRLQLAASIAPAGAGRFGPAQRLGARFPRGAVLAVAADGSALLAWRESDGRTWRLAVAFREAGAPRFGDARVLTNRGERVDGLRAVATGPGRFTVAWQGGAPGLGARTRTGAIRWARLQGATPVTPRSGRGFELRTLSTRPGTVVDLEPAPAGGAVVLWRRTVAAGGGLEIADLDRDRVGRRGRVSVPGDRTWGGALAVAGDGGATVAWRTLSASRLRSRVWLAVRGR